MFRVSFVFLALASALALNGCSQCSQQGTETAPVATATPADGAMAPADAMAPAATPVEGAPVEATPAADGAATAPADAAATPAAH